MIVGRAHEIKILEKLLLSKKAEFVAVYGRRRVGKTYLIRTYFSEQPVSFLQVVGIKNGINQLEQQLKEFKLELQRKFYQDFPSTTLKDPNSWHDAFAMLNDAIALQRKLKKKDKIVLFFDEFPWLATPRSGVLQAVDYYWNRYWSSDENIILIICGSATSWILEKIINNKGGLHNRVTLRLPIEVFNLKEVKTYLQEKIGTDLNLEQVVEIYMALGGVPYYLDHVKRGMSASQVIDTLLFGKNALLKDEFDNLYQSLFNQADTYIELIRIIASRTYGILRKDIEAAAKLTSKGGTLSKRLNDLEQSGFIRKVILPGNKRLFSYQCVDLYTLFYLKWIEPVLNVEVGKDYWQSIYNTPEYYSYAGIAFETLCYRHIEQIKKALNIPAGAIAYSWRSKSNINRAQIDLVIERKDGVINLCEIKYTKKPFVISKEYYDNLINKMKSFKQETKTSKQIFISMISAHGLKQNNYSGIISSSAELSVLFE